MQRRDDETVRQQRGGCLPRPTMFPARAAADATAAPRGVAAYDVTATANETTIEAAMNSRKGALVAAASTSTFAIPLLCCIGTLALKAIPLSALMDNITIEIRLASVNQYGVYSAAPAAADFLVKECKLFHSLIKLDGRVEAALYASLG